MKRVFLVFLILTTLTLSGSALADCGVDVFGLIVRDNLYMVGRINNTGDQYENIIYQFFVGGRLAGNGSLNLSKHEVITVEQEYPFSVGDYEINLTANIGCGYQDSESMMHIVKQPFECSDPYGLPGQNMCDYSSQQYLACSGGEWVVVAENSSDYCYNCPGVCGDSVCNCGENETCPDCVCEQEYIDDYRCYGGESQRGYQYSDCSTEWRYWEYCDYGCSNGVCNPRGTGTYCDCSGEQYIFNGESQGIRNLAFYENCSSECNLECFYNSDCLTGYGCLDFECISDFEIVCGVYIYSPDYSNNIMGNEQGFITAGVRNTGAWTETITLNFYLSGNLLESYSINLTEDEEAERTAYFTRSPGVYQVRVNASADCGSTDTRYDTLSVMEGGEVPGPVCDYDGVCDSGEDNLFCPEDCPAVIVPLVTDVSFRPGELDIELHRGKVVSIDIQSSMEQVFNVSVSGIPQDWVDYAPTYEISGVETLFLYVNPRGLGTYSMDIHVRAESEGLEFNTTIPVYVAVPQDEGFNWFLNRAREVMVYLLENTTTLVMLIAIMFIVIISLAAWKLREEGY